MLQVLALARRVEPHDRAELVLVGPQRHLACLAVLDPDDENASRPVRPSVSRFSSSRYWSGRTPIISRLERWMRS